MNNKYNGDGTLKSVADHSGHSTGGYVWDGYHPDPHVARQQQRVRPYQSDKYSNSKKARNRRLVAAMRRAHPNRPGTGWWPQNWLAYQ